MKRNAIAKEVETYHSGENGPRLEAGEFYFTWKDGRKVGIIHGCPCGCGRLSTLFFRGSGTGRAEWDVCGEWPKVTLAPSIGMRIDSEDAGFHWHGHLTDGVFEEC